VNRLPEIPYAPHKKGSGKPIVVVILLVIVALVFFAFASGNVECTGLRAASRYIDGLSGPLNTREFRNSYWHGFWSTHADCFICRTNGDVPARYR
jgi:hypothetical protein